MISFDFKYYSPMTIEEALDIYHTNYTNKIITYISGGTEFITFSRMNKMYADIVIDLKSIPACHALKMEDEYLVIGSCVTLNELAESNMFPLLGETVKYIADHTSRNKITIGGNICSSLIYKEGMLPFLLTKSQVKVASRDGEKVVPITEIFDEKLRLKKGEFVIQLLVNKKDIEKSYIHIKKTKKSSVDYPLVTIAALMSDKQLSASFSGLCQYPFRSVEIDTLLSHPSLTTDEKIRQVVSRLPEKIIEDINGSSGYREFVFKNALFELINKWEMMNK